MKLATDPREMTKIGIAEELEFSIEVTPQAMEVLSGLYSDIPWAIVREYGTNMLDAYVKLPKGKPVNYDEWVMGIKDGRSYCSDGLTQTSRQRGGHCAVLFVDPAVLHGHDPIAERNHLRAESHMLVVEQRFFWRGLGHERHPRCRDFRVNACAAS